MVKKMTYEELEQQIAKQKQFTEELQQDCEHLKQLVDQRTLELRKETTKRKQAEATLMESEGKFRSLVETTSDLIWEVDQNSVYTYVSPQVKNLLGYDPSEMLGKSVYDFMLPEEVEKVKETNKYAEESRKEIVMLEASTVHKDGHLVVLETNGAPIFGKNGDFLGYRGVDRDITARKKMEEELRVSNEKFAAIFRFSPNAIVVASLEGRRILDANEMFSQMSGYSREEVLGCSVSELNLWAFAEEEERYKNLLQQNGELHNFEITFNRKISSPGKGLVSASLFKLGDETCLIGILNDITDRKLAEEELKKHRDHLSELVAEQTKDLQKINEELRTEISERKQTEEALRESEGRYSNLFDETPVATIVIDNIGNIVDINKSHLEKIAGGTFGKKDYIGMDLLSHPSVAKAGVSGLYRKALKGQFIEAEQVYYPEVTRGTEGYFNVKASPVFDKKGDIRSVIVTHEEVTERKLSEDALRKSEEKYKSIFENVAVSIILVDAKGQMVDINPYHITHIGKGKVTKEKLQALNFFTYPTVINSGISEKLNKVLNGKLVNITEHYYPTTSGGTPGYFNTRAVPLFADGEVTGAVIMFDNITKVKESEELIRDLSHKLITSQENERQMISRELHDQVAQDLSALKISCEMLLQYKSLSSGIRNNISGISGKLHGVLKAVRNLSYDLRPSGLEELGLSETINRYCKEFSSNNDVNVEFLSAGVDNLRLKFEANINLYRLVQEGLNNVKKHADASNVSIKLISSFPNIILRVEDDGKGFDPEERLIGANKEKRMGLRSMKERVGLLQGKMRIDSFPGKGTKILIEFPYDEGTSRAEN